MRKKYYVEYLRDGRTYDMEVFTDYNEAMRFYNRVRRNDWARLV